MTALRQTKKTQPECFNGCKDNTREYLNSIKSNDIRYLWFNDGLGYTEATNIGIQQSETEYIILLNNDVVLLDWQYPSDWINILENGFKIVVVLDDASCFWGFVSFSFVLNFIN